MSRKAILLLLVLLGACGSDERDTVMECLSGGIQELNLSSPSSRQGDPSRSISMLWVGPDDTVYGVGGGSLWSSKDKGRNWKWIHKFPGEGWHNGMFVDMQGTVFVSSPSRGRLQMGKHRGVWKWSEPLAFKCGQGFWKMDQDSLGNLFVGEYAGAMDDTCAFIYKSSDGGDHWTEVFRADARHVHIVAADPYTGFLYAGLGDGPARASLVMSTDVGGSWRQLLSETCLAQPVSIVFVPGSAIFGSDCIGENGIYRVGNDMEVSYDLELKDKYDTYVWALSTNPQGVIFAGTITTESASTVPGIYLSADEGNTWCLAKDLGITEETYHGVNWISNFDSEGYAYYHENVTDSIYRFRYVPPEGLR